MNLFDAAKILHIRDWQLAEKLGVSRRTFERYKKKVGVKANPLTKRCRFTVDMFNGQNERDEALKNFDSLWAQFVGAALQRKKRNGI